MVKDILLPSCDINCLITTWDCIILLQKMPLEFFQSNHVIINDYGCCPFSNLVAEETEASAYPGKFIFQYLSNYNIFVCVQILNKNRSILKPE